MRGMSLIEFGKELDRLEKEKAKQKYLKRVNRNKKR